MLYEGPSPSAGAWPPLPRVQEGVGPLMGIGVRPGHPWLLQADSPLSQGYMEVQGQAHKDQPHVGCCLLGAGPPLSL